jgi:CheY-like chemotaxis protein
MKPSGNEPFLGGQRAIRLTGFEPALSGAAGSPYGRFRVAGLEAPPVNGRKRPLVVFAEFDDNTAELVQLLAESNGYEVRRTNKGADALHLVRAIEPNMLVVTFRLPGMNGMELIHSVRTHPDKLVQNLPILVMDVRHGTRIVRDVFSFGADDFLELPCELPAMLRAWRRVTGFLRRPFPLTAAANENESIREVALDSLLESRPEGLVNGLGELLWQPDPEVRAAVRASLRRLGTPEAKAVLERHIPPRWVDENR